MGTNEMGMKRRMAFGLVLLAIACTEAALASEMRPEIARTLGCFEIVLGKWDPELALGEDQAYLEPAKIVELTSKLYLKPRVEDDWLAVRMVSGAKPGVYDAAYWEALNDDYVAVTFTNGHSGVGIIVKYDRTEMRGTAGTFWDFPRQHQTAPAVLRRVKCGDKRSNNRLNPTVGPVTGLARAARPAPVPPAG